MFGWIVGIAITLQLIVSIIIVFGWIIKITMGFEFSLSALLGLVLNTASPVDTRSKIALITTCQQEKTLQFNTTPENVIVTSIFGHS